MLSGPGAFVGLMEFRASKVSDSVMFMPFSVVLNTGREDTGGSIL